MRNFLKTLWQFGRPHTLVGTTVSICSLYLLATQEQWLNPQNLLPGIASLASGLLCNVFITGYNQITDLPLDRINKPFLPIPAGNLPVNRARRVVVAALAISWILALLVGFSLLVWVVIISALGALYSWKKTRLKRWHAAAALSIVMVRAWIVNLGIYSALLNDLPFTFGDYQRAIPLTVFITFFSLGIAWYKDIPDVTGDRTYRIGTLAVRLGRKKAWLAASVVVIAGYVAMALPVWNVLNPVAFSITHTVLLVVFLLLLAKTDVHENHSITRFYKMFWVLFAVEYLVYPFIG